VLVSLVTDPARPDHDNEDFAAASANVAVLLDGAGTPGGAESGCVHGVAWFTQQLGTQLLAEASQDDQRPLPECLRNAISHTRKLHEETCDLDHPGTPSSTVIAIRLGKDDAVEYLVLADSVLLFDVIGGDPVALTDDREARVGSAHRAAMDALPSGSTEHDLALKEYVETLRKYRNAADGFWVAASDASAADHALTGSEPRDTLRAVALLSDGASRLADRFHLIDWAGVLQLLGKESPQQLIDRVRAAERDDPRGERWPRGKVHDDATAVYVPLTIA
jgi:Protein phosphatase 2C